MTKYTPEQRLQIYWSKIDRKDDTSCWIWRGMVNVEGYGRMKSNGKYFFAHRKMWELINGEIPKGKKVLQSCDNKLCCNPNHLVLGDERSVMFKKFPMSERIEYFWSKVDVSECPEKCWNWLGRTDKDGYGLHTWQHRPTRANRIAWMLSHPNEPAGELYVCHTCDNPLCCNPKHLFLGTNLDNMKDRHAKGRYHGIKGDKNAHHKLTWSDVRSIRAEYVPRVVTQRSLADKYGVSQSIISRIVLDKGWVE